MKQGGTTVSLSCRCKLKAIFLKNYEIVCILEKKEVLQRKTPKNVEKGNKLNIYNKQINMYYRNTQ
jgi:hypothetical protein